jgi:PAS domain S-box-containing protein
MNRPASIERPGPPRPDELAAFRAIAELAGDAAIIVDCGSRKIRYLSDGAGQLLGCSTDELQEKLASNQPGPLAPVCEALAARLAAPDHERNVRELDLVHREGRVIPAQLISRFVLDDAGQPVALAAIIRDQSPLRAVQAEQKRFASMLNHEFRTPLAVIDGAVQRLEATTTGADEATRQRYRKIGAAVDRLIGMLDEYLSPERMGAIGRQRQPTSMAPRQLLEEGAAIARAAGRHATIEAGELPAALRCEPDGLRLAFKVLLDNAIQFSPSDSVIVLAGRRADGGIELAVRDSGPGIPEQEAAHIFDKFYRGANAAGLPGSGLGLYMARSVIEVHGGTLGHVNLDGGGSEFRICLPTRGGDAGKLLAPDPTNSDNSTQHGVGAGQNARAE